jgi:hypothetical protein
MAGLKKPTKKRDTTNPNTVLVIFLVFFVLLSIGLGIWGYYGYAGQEKLRVTAKEEIQKAGANKVGEDFARFAAFDYQQAIGVALDAADLNSWKTLRDQVLDENGKFKAEPGRAVVKKVRDESAVLLGGFDDNQGYKTTFKVKLARLETEAKDAKASMTTARTEADEAKKGLEDLRLKVEKYWTDVLALIKKGNAETLKESRKMSKTMQDQMALNEEQQKQLTGIDEKYKDQLANLSGKIKVLETQKKTLEEKVTNASSIFVSRTGGDPHALVLDVSKGKTIWDQPRGKIARVDFESRQVIINIGSNAGVKPQTTFNVFGASWKGQAEGLMKGTVEVIRVLDGNTSVARITSLYDASGAEIALNDAAIGRVSREASNLMKKDDLLFNLTFGAHAFISGAVHWDGSGSTTPAGQTRNLREFMAILERQGVKIDGYIDLTDGKIVGGITPQTRFIVRGQGLAVEKKVAKEGEKAEEPAGGREKNVNDAMLAVRNEAIEKGLFIISADNLVNVIGYRQPRSANDAELSSFRPSLPSAAGQGN